MRPNPRKIWLKDASGYYAKVNTAAAMVLTVVLLCAPGCQEERWDRMYYCEVGVESGSVDLGGFEFQERTNGNGLSMAQVSARVQFENAGPAAQRPVDMAGLSRVRPRKGQYRVVSGDVLEFRMPAVLRVLSADLTDTLGQVEPYSARVGKDGTITLPIVGPMAAAGMTLGQIEELVTNAYYPKYVRNRPSVVGRVVRYRTAKVTIMGAVANPGVYECRSDEMSLVAVIMKAGRIVNEGASVIRIVRGDREVGRGPFVLPVKGLNIPFADVALEPGDVVEVERRNPEVFTVIGLVNNSGTFPYKVGAKYNLIQAIAFAHGVNEIAEPRYANIYRQGADGSMLCGSYPLGGRALLKGAAVLIKPGDVIEIEQTFGTRSRQFLARVLRLSTGASVEYRP